MADDNDEARKLGRREHVMKFIPPGHRQDIARRVFELLDQAAPSDELPLVTRP